MLEYKEHHIRENKQFRYKIFCRNEDVNYGEYDRNNGAVHEFMKFREIRKLIKLMFNDFVRVKSQENKYEKKGINEFLIFLNEDGFFKKMICPSIVL